MIKFKNLFLCSILGALFIWQNCNAEIQIQSYKKNYSWKANWTSVIIDELKKDEYRIGELAMLNLEINENDLEVLECSGYNKATHDEKSDFWVVFFSGLARSESGFNEKARSPMSRGHRSLGLLQLASATAKTRCGIYPPDSSVLDAQDNLICGIKLMSWQLHGAPISSDKFLRADLEGHLFGKYMFQWGPLRQNDHRGRRILTNWFKDHLEQLKFCHQSLNDPISHI
ncbi:MAG: transglycosylase SLT domain-containing protein [Bacteriovorax sp.]|nr:transglycosylase SLT domain-containing protein [Bacteriovorax sp.]